MSRVGFAKGGPEVSRIKREAAATRGDLAIKLLRDLVRRCTQVGMDAGELKRAKEFLDWQGKWP